MVKEVKHIIIKKPEDCCGCSACLHACPTQCINFYKDKKGFAYPTVNESQCIECGQCRRVCPVINPRIEQIPTVSYGSVRNSSPNIEKSSSAGAFYLLASKTIEEGGIVFGARYNDEFTEVYHAFADTIEGVQAFQGSKYMQSDLRNTFKECKDFLQQGRAVLFSGVPCQIAGLKNFLGKEYEKLLTVDLICHGVPSSKVWGDYLMNIVLPNLPKGSIIENINFRDNRLGWLDFGTSVSYKDNNGHEGTYFLHHNTDDYFRSFNMNLFLRDACYKCPIKLGRSHSDITLGDFWGVRRLRPDVNSEKSIAVILANTEHGLNCISKISLNLFDSSFTEILNSNPNLYQITRSPLSRNAFWDKYFSDGIRCLPLIIKQSSPTRFRTVLSHVKQILSLILHFDKK